MTIIETLAIQTLNQNSAISTTYPAAPHFQIAHDGVIPLRERARWVMNADGSNPVDMTQLNPRVLAHRLQSGGNMTLKI